MGEISPPMYLACSIMTKQCSMLEISDVSLNLKFVFESVSAKRPGKFLRQRRLKMSSSLGFNLVQSIVVPIGSPTRLILFRYKLVSTLSETRRLFRLFRINVETACFVVSISPKHPKTIRNKEKWPCPCTYTYPRPCPLHKSVLIFSFGFVSKRRFLFQFVGGSFAKKSNN